MLLLSTILLCMALQPLPYGYYVLLKFIVCFTCIKEILVCSKHNVNTLLIFLALILLYNPIIKMPLGKPIWGFVNILTGIYFIYYLIKNKKNL